MRRAITRLALLAAIVAVPAVAVAAGGNFPVPGCNNDVLNPGTTCLNRSVYAYSVRVWFVSSHGTLWVGNRRRSRSAYCGYRGCRVSVNLGRDDHYGVAVMNSSYGGHRTQIQVWAQR